MRGGNTGGGQFGAYRPVPGLDQAAFAQHARRRRVRVRSNQCHGRADQPLPGERGGLPGENQAFLGGMALGRVLR